MDYPGIDGFLGNRASLMLDIVFLAMFLTLPVLAWSIYQVKFRRRFLLHKRVQIALGMVLLVTVLLFELDMRLNGWRPRAVASPFYDPDWSQGWVNRSLWIHLCFAISALVLWIVVISHALWRFPNPPQPNRHASIHRLLGRLAALDMTLTAVTGWIFYWLAFVAS